MNARSPHRRGATLVEAVAALAVAALLAALLATSASESRRGAQLQGSLANLQHYAAGTQIYGADYQDAIWSLTWRPGTNSSSAWADLRAASSYPEMQANQAIDIIRRRAGLTAAQMPKNTNRVFNRNYSHLVLVDHLAGELPAHWAVSPADHKRQLWLRSREGNAFCQLSAADRPTDGSCEPHWIYSSSYELAPAFWTPDASGGGVTTVSQATTVHNAFTIGNAPFGGRTLDQIAFPSQKVMVFDQFQRHFGRELWYAYPEARVVMMLADGSADARRTADANRGFNPLNPTSTQATLYRYMPDSWEPRTASGAPSDIVTGYYRWTRSGLRGRDFGGPEVPWTAP